MLQLVVNGVAAAAVIALSASAFSLVYNVARVFNIAQAALYVWAAYACYSLYVLLHQPLIAAIAVSLMTPAILGLLTELLVFRRLRRSGASSLVNFVASIGLYVVLTNILPLLFGNETRLFRTGAQPTFRVGSVIVAAMQAAQIAGGLVVLLVIGMFLSRTRWGRMVRAVADNPALAICIGINVQLIRCGVFAIAGLLAGTASLLIAFDVGVDPYAGLSPFFSACVAGIVASRKYVLGAVISSLLISQIQVLTLWAFSARWVEAATFVVLILILIVRKPEPLSPVNSTTIM